MLTQPQEIRQQTPLSSVLNNKELEEKPIKRGIYGIRPEEIRPARKLLETARERKPTSPAQERGSTSPQCAKIFRLPKERAATAPVRQLTFGTGLADNKDESFGTTRDATDLVSCTKLWPSRVAPALSTRRTKMKTLLFACALVLLGTASGFGQGVAGARVLNSEPVKIQPLSHPEHASQRALADTQSLLENANYSYAVGKRPLWEFVSKQPAMPLGDVARLLRKEHETAKKASVVYEN